MKMKEVCERTGLTERTVRFYVEQKLINPKSTIKNGREYTDYSEQDVKELLTIADLRRLFFTINEIKEMKAFPENISEVVTVYKDKLEAEATTKIAIVQSLEKINLSSIHHVAELTNRLKDVSAKLELPARDVNPDFGKFDQESKAEKEREYQQFEKRQKRRFLTGKYIVYTVASLHIVSTIVSLFINWDILSFIIQMALGIALFAGVTWVRYLFVVGAVINIFLTLSLIIGPYPISPMDPVLIWILIMQMLYSTAAGVLLLVHSGVREFEYVKKNG